MRHNRFFNEITEGRIRGKPTTEFTCYMIWQMIMAVLHANGQQRTEKKNDFKKLLYSKRLGLLILTTSIGTHNWKMLYHHQTTSNV